MAKPMLVTLPFVLLLLDYWPLGRFEFGEKIKDTDWKILYRLVLEKIAFFALSAASSVITFIAQQKGGAVATMHSIPLINRLANTSISYIAYIGKMLWPARLAMLYPHPLDKRCPA